MADARITVESELTVDGTPIRLVRASLREAMFEVPTLEVEGTEGEETPQAEDVIGKPAQLRISRSDGSQERQFAGVVVEADRIVDDNGNFRLRLLVAPKLWKLSRRRDCAIYQKKSVPDIVKSILADAGVDEAEWMVTGTYKPRDYVVEYRETDLDFVLRMLAEEGIWFAFDFSGGSDKIVFCDDVAGRGEIPGQTSLTYQPKFGFAELSDIVTKVRRMRRVRSDKVFTRDYDFEKPKVQPEATKEGKDEGAKSLEVYLWPGRFTDKSIAERYAQNLLDSLQAERDIVTGQTAALTLAPGLKFSIENHPVAALNAEMLVTRATIEMRDERWTQDLSLEGGEHYCICTFEAIPTGKSAYRPPRRKAERTVPGLQTALTTGPSGEEIHVDQHGRVRVYFHWDRLGKKDETSSHVFRTCQLPTGGSMFLPRVGWEVSVDFVEGDVDRPMIFQRMYNALTPPPYELPKNKARGSIQTATTPGGGSTNEFRMDDTKGKEEMFFNASKDMTVEVKNNTTEAVKNNEKREIGSNATLNVTNSLTHEIGACETVTVSGNQTVAIQTFNADEIGGSHTATIGGNRSMMIGGDHKTEVAAGSTYTIGALCTHLVVGGVSESTPAAYNHTVGAALIEMAVGDRSVTVGATHTETIGALKVIVTNANRAVDCGAILSKAVGGAILNKISGDRNDNSQAMYSEIVAGAQVVKANNVTFEATTMISLVMGASTLTILPAMVSIAGVSVKLDGATVDTGIVLDN